MKGTGIPMQQPATPTESNPSQSVDPSVKASTVQEAKPAAPVPNLDPGLYDLGQTALWVGTIIFGVVLFRRQVATLFAAALRRIRAGAPLKIASFELGGLPQIQQGAALTTKVRGIAQIRDDDGAFDRSRAQFKTEFRNLFLVHRIAPSEDPDQLYDVVIYLVPSLKHGSLSGVVAAEYYMGKYWGRRVFRSIDRATGFLIATAAYAPFTCTARICFSDGETVFLHRFIDFEMGQLPPGAFREADA
jgi:hypothetical protein